LTSVWHGAILDKNNHHDLKDIFKGATVRAATAEPTFQEFYAALLAKERNYRGRV
jgi:hypothetical protein